MRVEFRVRPSEKQALASRAASSRVSLAQLLRVMTQLELEPENRYSAATYLRMAAGEEKEMERRGRVRAGV